MPRTLPWLTASDTNGRVKRESTPRKRRIKCEGSADDDKGKAVQETPSSPSEKRDFFRSSQTPPTSPIQKCPSEEFLIEGFDNDDIYVMVEDEFYAVAQSFTQHLHYAEYVRRKKEAKLQNAAAIRDLARPTDGTTPMTEETRRRKTSEALSARQKAGLEQMTTGKRPRVDSDGEKDVQDAEDDGDDLWAGTSLQDLMMSPRKARSLVGLQGVKSSTRAAAGYSQASKPTRARSDNVGASLPQRANNNNKEARQVQVVDDDETASEADDADLDIPTRRNISAPKLAKPPLQKPPPARTKSDTPPTMRTGYQASRSKTDLETKKTPAVNARHRHRISSLFKRRRELLFDDFDDISGQDNADALTKDSRRSLSSIDVTPKKNAQGNDTRSKKSRLNEVPTFLV